MERQLPFWFRSGRSGRFRGATANHGYDSVNDDYKVVTLSYYDTDNEYQPDCIDTFVDVYSVKRGVWKRVDSSPYDHAVPEIASGAYVNGAYAL